MTFWVKLSFLQISKVQVKWHIFSYNAGLNSKYWHIYGTNKTSKNNEIQRKSEHKIALPAKWQKFTYDLLAFNRRSMHTPHKTHLNFALFVSFFFLNLQMQISTGTIYIIEDWNYEVAITRNKINFLYILHTTRKQVICSTKITTL